LILDRIERKKGITFT